MAYNPKYYESEKKYRQANYKRVGMDIKKEEYEQLKKYCDDNNIKVNTFIKSLLAPYMRKD